MASKKATKDMRVQDVMSRDVVTIRAEDSIHEALELIVENRVAALPVVNAKGKCVGMLSATDLICLARDLDDELQHADSADLLSNAWLRDVVRGGIGNDRVKEHMTADVACVYESTALRAAATHAHRRRRQSPYDGPDRRSGS